MKVLIMTSNEQIIRDILPKVKFIESSSHTEFFNVTTKTFEKLYKEVKFLGYNPYALMTW
jgi:hypothetical protein